MEKTDLTEKSSNLSKIKAANQAEADKWAVIESYLDGDNNSETETDSETLTTKEKQTLGQAALALAKRAGLLFLAGASLVGIGNKVGNALDHKSIDTEAETAHEYELSENEQKYYDDDRMSTGYNSKRPDYITKTINQNKFDRMVSEQGLPTDETKEATTTINNDAEYTPNHNLQFDNKYEIKPGDTFTSIAKRLNTSVEVLQSANPDIEPENMQPGATITIPILRD